jgi:NhaP-type Na+/H+ or K+/H+ antiporter
MPDVTFWGGLAFGLLIGWYVYYINRHRRADVQLSDIVTLIGILGGAAITALFPASTNQFAGYAIGLAIGFFSYFIVLLLLVAKSADFNSDWFLDGRRKNPAEGWGYGEQTQRPMGEEGVED